MQEIMLFAVGVAAVLAGVVGTIIPALPGLPLIFSGLLWIAWVDEFAHVGWGALAVLGGVMVLGMVLDFVAGLLGAKMFGASRHALWGSLIGSVLGIFVLGVLGLVVGPLLGAAVGELIARRDVWQAGKVATATLIGLVLGALAKVGAALALIGGFMLAWWV